MIPGGQKRYFVNNINVSQSHISQEYEMKFDESIDQSKRLGNSSIKESMQHKNFRGSMGSNTNKQQPVNKALNQIKNAPESGFKSPNLVSLQYYHALKQKFLEIKKFSTDDPDILMDFFMYYKYQGADTRDKTIRDLEMQINKLYAEPNKQDSQSKAMKLQKKIDLERALMCDSNQMYYTLHHLKNKNDLDKKVQADIKRKQEEYKLMNKNQNKRNTEEVINRLYPQQNNTKLSQKQKEQIDKLNIAKKILELYEERQQFDSKDLTLDNLYDMWLAVPDKKKVGLEANKKEIPDMIKNWMCHNIKNLAKAHFDKKGIKTDDATTLYNFLMQMNSLSLNNYAVMIPRKGFVVFYEYYALNKKAEAEQRQLQQKRAASRRKIKQQQIRQKVLKRPVSSTPLGILSQPKNGNIQQILQLIKKYPHDKNLKRILAQKSIPAIRRPEEYGCFSLQQQIKIKNRVKHEQNKNTQKIIENMLLDKTVKFEMKQYQNSLMSLLGEENLAKQQKWKKTSPLIKQALEVELYSGHYLSPCLHQFCETYIKSIESPSKTDTNTLIVAIMEHLSNSPKTRQNKISHFRSMIEKVRQQKQKAETQEEKKHKQIEKSQKKKFYTFLLQWARVYIQSFIQNKLQNQSRRDFMNQFYSKCIELHKPYLTKHFPVFQQTQGLKSIHSPLLKYEFFKMVKDINPQTMQIDHRAKNAAWTPAGRSDGFSTFNRLSTAYYHQPKAPEYNDRTSPNTKDKKKPVQNVWEKDKANQRIKFMMKMSDATQCTFKPKISKK